MFGDSPVLQKHFVWFLIAGVLIQHASFVVADNIERSDPGADVIVFLLLVGFGSGLNVFGCYYWAQRGAYNGNWAWMGLLSYIGFIVLGIKFKHSLATRELPGFSVLPPPRPVFPAQDLTARAPIPALPLDQVIRPLGTNSCKSR